MKKRNSKKGELDIETLKRLGRNTLIMFSPVILLSLDQIQKGDFDYKILIAMAIGIISDAIRRYLTDYNK